MTVEEKFLDFAKAHNLPFRESDADGQKVFSFVISGTNGKYAGHALCLENERLFVFFIDFGLHVRKENLPEAAQRLMDINYNLKMGNFQMDSQNGLVIVRTCQGVYGREEEQIGVIERSVLTAGMIADKYKDQLLREFS